jgi:hypothetical protein
MTQQDLLADFIHRLQGKHENDTEKRHWRKWGN